ncbi:hypothetical protein EXS71_01310 [Candidatus Uhrbacteria bacterium]|nr:hypothetical protein [Candidatus Uhrbacteria bacterium]
MVTAVIIAGERWRKEMKKNWMLEKVESGNTPMWGVRPSSGQRMDGGGNVIVRVAAINDACSVVAHREIGVGWGRVEFQFEYVWIEADGGHLRVSVVGWEAGWRVDIDKTGIRKWTGFGKLERIRDFDEKKVPDRILKDLERLLEMVSE